VAPVGSVLNDAKVAVMEFAGSSIGDGAGLLANVYGDAAPDRRDREEPGRGLGLGGALPSIESETLSSPRLVIMTVSVVSALNCKLGILGRSCSRTENAEDGRRRRETKRGFLPLSRTFFRALALTQLIICRSASRSETTRVGRTDVGKPTVRGMVLCAWGIGGRMGVSKRLTVSGGSENRMSNKGRLTGREIVEGI